MELQSYLDYLETQPKSNFFIAIFLKDVNVINVGSGQEILSFIINLLDSIFPCIVIG